MRCLTAGRNIFTHRLKFADFIHPLSETEYRLPAGPPCIHRLHRFLPLYAKYGGSRTPPADLALVLCSTPCHFHQVYPSHPCHLILSGPCDMPVLSKTLSRHSSTVILELIGRQISKANSALYTLDFLEPCCNCFRGHSSSSACGKMLRVAYAQLRLPPLQEEPPTIMSRDPMLKRIWTCWLVLEIVLPPPSSW